MWPQFTRSTASIIAAVGLIAFATSATGPIAFVAFLTGRGDLRTTGALIVSGLAAGYGAKKLGGGCFSTVLIFLILWWLLGNFGIFQ